MVVAVAVVGVVVVSSPRLVINNLDTHHRSHPMGVAEEVVRLLLIMVAAEVDPAGLVHLVLHLSNSSSSSSRPQWWLYHNLRLRELPHLPVQVGVHLRLILRVLLGPPLLRRPVERKVNEEPNIQI